MHVCLSLLTLFPGRMGGSETNVRGLLGAFAAGHGPDQLTLLGNRHVGERYAGWPVRLEPRYRPGDADLTRYLAMQAGRVWPRIDGRAYDVVHRPFTTGVPRITGAPSVVSLLDVQHHELPDMFGRAERRLRAWAYDRAARDADRVITISEHARRGIVEHVGVPAERIDVIGLGIDHERFTEAGPARDDLGDYVLYPANLWPHKNHARLLEAWRAVPDLTLVLTGQTYGPPPTGERVVHLGHVPADALPALYRGARAVVFPSLFEGFGVPVLEAMACGVPVAASDRGALGEIAGDAALLFDPQRPEAIADAVLRITGDKPLRARLRAAGLERARRFTWEDAADRHLEVYEKAAR